MPTLITLIVYLSGGLVGANEDVTHIVNCAVGFRCRRRQLFRHKVLFLDRIGVVNDAFQKQHSLFAGWQGGPRILGRRFWFDGSFSRGRIIDASVQGGSE